MERVPRTRRIPHLDFERRARDHRALAGRNCEATFGTKCHHCETRGPLGKHPQSLLGGTVAQHFGQRAGNNRKIDHLQNPLQLRNGRVRVENGEHPRAARMPRRGQGRLWVFRIHQEDARGFDAAERKVPRCHGHTRIAIGENLSSSRVRVHLHQCPACMTRVETTHIAKVDARGTQRRECRLGGPIPAHGTPPRHPVAQARQAQRRRRDLTAGRLRKVDGRIALPGGSYPDSVERNLTYRVDIAQ